MNYKVKEFIEDNIDLIEDNNWVEFYEKAYITLKHPGELTRILLEANVHPLSEINVISYGYFMGYDDKPWSFYIPKHIEEIQPNAFADNHSLNSIYIPKSVKKIGTYIIQNDTALAHIFYEGSAEEWDEVQKRLGWSDFSSPFEIVFNTTM